MQRDEVQDQDANPPCDRSARKCPRNTPKPINSQICSEDWEQQRPSDDDTNQRSEIERQYGDEEPDDTFASYVLPDGKRSNERANASDHNKIGSAFPKLRLSRHTKIICTQNRKDSEQRNQTYTKKSQCLPKSSEDNHITDANAPFRQVDRIVDLVQRKPAGDQFVQFQLAVVIGLLQRWDIAFQNSFAHF